MCNLRLPAVNNRGWGSGDHTGKVAIVQEWISEVFSSEQADKIFRIIERVNVESRGA